MSHISNNNDSPSLQELHELRERLSSNELNQSHLFKGWPQSPKEYLSEHLNILKELFIFSKHYNGGVEQYIRNGKSLFSINNNNNNNNNNNMEQEYISLEQPPYMYEAPSLFKSSDILTSMEQEGKQIIKKTIFVLVAGGLGERLGFSGIKLALPVETATYHCYLSHYLSWVKFIAGKEAPFVIMTSDDTHKHTQKLLEEMNHEMQNIYLLKQETVFCFTDTEAHLAIKNNKFIRKPHGHGDVHSLLYQAKDNNSGEKLVEKWLKQGYNYIVFFQDTNATATLTIPISLSISARENLAMNFTCVPRQPKEAIGLLCNVKTRNSNISRTINIEYNKFESVAASLTNVGGDCALSGSQYSPFPGSINTLIFNFNDYIPLLNNSHGSVPEFINPKYIDESKTQFKPCRIESLMQDFALLFNPEKHKVGATTFTRFTYQPVKNALHDGVKKVKEGVAPHCAATGEEDYYKCIRLRLQAAGLSLPTRLENEFDIEIQNTIKLQLFPVIVADVVAMGVSSNDIHKRLLPNPQNVKISSKSVLIIEGKVCIESLELDGALRIIGPTEENATPLIVKGLIIKNESWKVRPTSIDKDKNEVDNIRGFVFEPREIQTIHYAKL